MTVYIAIYHMREETNPWPQSTWTYSQGINATDPADAALGANAFAGAFMVGHSSTITCEGIGVYSAPKADHLFRFDPTDISGGVTITGSRTPLWNTMFTQFPAAEGRVGFHHWRTGLGAGDYVADNVWDSSIITIMNSSCNSFVVANPDLLCKPSGVNYVPITRTDDHPHMRQFGARTPVGGRPGGSALASSKKLAVK